MSDNSNPQGTGTTELSDADLDQWEGDVSEQEDTSETDDNEDIGDDSDDQEEADQDADKEGDDEEEGDKEADDPDVDLGDGNIVKLSELKRGYQRTADYTRKTQALAAEQKRLEATTAMFSQQAEVIQTRKKELDDTFDLTIDLLAKRLPEQPDANLAYTDPQSYIQQKAFYDAGMSEIQRVMQTKEAARKTLETAELENERSMLMVEGQKLEAAFPHIRNNPDAKEKLWKSTYGLAAKYNISSAEMDGIKDARVIIILAKLAGYMAREKTTPKVANGVVQKVAPRPQSTVAPRKAIVGQSSKSLKAFRENKSTSSAEKAWDDLDFSKL